jgi:hypothetical protein
MDDGVAAAIDKALPERLKTLQRVGGIPVVFGGGTRPAELGRQLQISRLLGTLGESLRGLCVPPGRGLGGMAVSTALPQRVNDYATAAKITHEYDAIVVTDERITSLFAVPVVVRGTVRGVLYGAVRGCQPIGHRAVRAAGVVASQLARDLERLRADGEDTRPGSLPLLDELAEIIEQTRDRGQRARLLRIHRQLAGRPAGELKARPAASVSLPDRELDVLRLVAVGATNLDIALAPVRLGHRGRGAPLGCGRRPAARPGLLRRHGLGRPGANSGGLAADRRGPNADGRSLETRTDHLVAGQRSTGIGDLIPSSWAGKG